MKEKGGGVAATGGGVGRRRKTPLFLHDLVI
jgi:hypothetical protein